MKTLIAVIGSANAEKPAYDLAFETGREIIKAGFTLLCGGLSGVMEAASKGAYSEAGKDSGRIIGILPGTNKNDANPYIDIAVPTGIGYARNMIVACASDAVIAIAGGSGTLSELAMAWQYGKPIVVIEKIDGVSGLFAGRSLDDRRNDCIQGASNAKEAVNIIKRLLGKKSSKE
ncbi:MAG: TIGR00725 family protein [Spirochaetota bacterium]|nr:MAG: TIGR00725 family protein [Spirochaetota bacterium]